jgi:hypothetical protein
MRHMIVMALGALALAGCQKTEEKAASADGAGTAATASAPASLGMRKAGLWTQTVSTEGMNQTMKMCMDAASLAEASVAGQDIGKDRCSKQAVTARPGGWSFDSVCETGDGGTVTSKGTATGNGEGYKMDVTMTTTGSPMPQANRTMNMKMEAKWEGPCPAGMAAGDIQVNGMTINAGAMKAMKDKMGKAPGN